VKAKVIHVGKNDIGPYLAYVDQNTNEYRIIQLTESQLKLMAFQSVDLITKSHVRS